MCVGERDRIISCAVENGIVPDGYILKRMTPAEIEAAWRDYRGFGGRAFDDEIQHLIKLLDQRRRVKSRGASRISYGLRAEIGSQIDNYFCNGALVIAALLLDLPVWGLTNSANALVGVK